MQISGGLSVYVIHNLKYMFELATLTNRLWFCTVLNVGMGFNSLEIDASLMKSFVTRFPGI